MAEGTWGHVECASCDGAGSFPVTLGGKRKRTKQCRGCHVPFSPCFVQRLRCEVCTMSYCCQLRLNRPGLPLDPQAPLQRVCLMCAHTYAPHGAAAFESKEHRITVTEIPVVCTRDAPTFSLASDVTEKDCREHYFSFSVGKNQLCWDESVTIRFSLTDTSPNRTAGTEATDQPCLTLTRRLGRRDGQRKAAVYFSVGHAATWSVDVTLHAGESGGRSQVHISMEMGRLCFCEVEGLEGANAHSSKPPVSAQTEAEQQAVWRHHMGVMTDGNTSADSDAEFLVGTNGPQGSLSRGSPLGFGSIGSGGGGSVGTNRPYVRPRIPSLKEEEDYDADGDQDSNMLTSQQSIHLEEFAPAFSPHHDMEFADHGSMKYNLKAMMKKSKARAASTPPGPPGQVSPAVTTPGGPPLDQEAAVTPGGPGTRTLASLGEWQSIDDIEADFGFVKMDSMSSVGVMTPAMVSKRNLAKSRIKNDMSMNSAMREEITRWPSYVGHTIVTYPMHLAIMELSRHSPFKEQAYELGLIRPFLLLVSMHPEARMSWAKMLEVPIWEKSYAGDSHEEAWEMLVADGKSVQARAKCVYSKEGDWYQLLYKMCRKALYSSTTSDEGRQRVESYLSEASTKTWQETNAHCREQRNLAMSALEEVFLSGLVEVFDEIRRDHEMDGLAESTKDLMEGDLIEPLVAKLRCAGFKDVALMRRLAASTYEGRGTKLIEKMGEKWGFTGEQMETPGVCGTQSVRMANVPAGMADLTAVIAATPLIALSPLIILPALAMTANASKYAIFRQASMPLLLPIIGICSQREMLAYHNIYVDDFYPVALDDFETIDVNDEETPGSFDFDL